MRRSITVVAVVVLLTLHVLQGACECLWNLWRNFGPFGYRNRGAFRRGLELGQVGPRAICIGVKHIKGWVISRRCRMLLKLAV
jgi:hypothetical protein